MVFSKISSVAGWMGRENQGDWKIVLSSRCRNYIVSVIHTSKLVTTSLFYSREKQLLSVSLSA